MKRRNLIAMVAGLAVLASACGGSVFSNDTVRASGEIIEDTLELQPFTSVSVEGPVEVDVIVDGTHQASLRMDRELERRAMIETSDGGFTLEFPDDMSVQGPIVSELTLHVTRLDTVRVRGAASLTFERLDGERVSVDLSGASRITGGGIDADRLEIDVSGASELQVDPADVGDVVVDSSGASAVTIGGAADRLVIDASGASVVDGSDLAVAAVDVELSGASTADVRSDGAVEGDLSGASHLHIAGDATVDVDTSGASSVQRR